MPNNVLVQSIAGFRVLSSKTRNKKRYVEVIISRLIQKRAELFRTNPLALVDVFRELRLPSGCARHVSALVSKHLEEVFGTEVGTVLRMPPNTVSSDVQDCHIYNKLDWMNLPHEDLIRRFKRVLFEGVAACIRQLPPEHRPNVYPRSHLKNCAGLVEHVVRRARFLASIGYDQLCDIFLACLPYGEIDELRSDTVICFVLEFEYGDELMRALTSVAEPVSDRNKKRRREEKQRAIKKRCEDDAQCEREWPCVVSKDVVVRCLDNYRTSSQWTEPRICAVCARYQSDAEPIAVFPGESGLDLDQLSVHSGSVSWKNVDRTLSPAFAFICPRLRGLMLDKRGVVEDIETSAAINLCQCCRTSLVRERMPQFALANNLYRGELPEEFSDLTWVEERICAIYCTTAHVTRLFQSSDPSQPRIFHGNTCAHNMNVVSTARVLPRTPSDVNGYLSVVFVGPIKIDPKNLGPMFRVRKAKVWSFLLWLRVHNRLYADIPLDPEVMSLYPEDGAIPGVSERVIHDCETDVRSAFEEETAGFESHPAVLLYDDKPECTGGADDSSSMEPNEPVVMLEKMGVSDPECDKVSGRTFTASALRNLFLKSGSSQLSTSSSLSLPDLVVYRGSQPVNEYNNTNLLPGMYPTLFPFGIGGFEDPQRPTSISFQQQARYCLQLADRLFRYHHSFIFVTLNIIQRRQAHLQTYFTCKRSHFQSIARQITEVSPKVLESLASRLEQECKQHEFSLEEKNALTLLKHVRTISARIPGSEASKIYVRNEIRSYFSYFGLPHLFFTFNPSPAHSPIFQVMFSNSTVDLSERFPHLVDARQRAVRLAQDPVAAVDFFDFSV